jgi:hypothetical protein
VVEPWILTWLRNQRFLSLAEPNAAICGPRHGRQRASDA